MNKQIISDEDLDKVVGGLFEFYKKSGYVKFTHQDETVTQHDIVDYDKAWELCCELEAKNWDEDKILQELITKKYIKP